MFCPDCGTENVKSQKFCVRCGSNILAMDRAREIIGEVANGGGGREAPSSQLLRIIALISISGFACITIGIIFLMLIDNDGPIPFVFGVGGFISLIMICRFLLRASNPAPGLPLAERTLFVPPVAPSMPRTATNRELTASAVPFQSVTEESTRQFEKER